MLFECWGGVKMALLRKGKTKSILESSIDSALLAVEIYNKPRTVFKVENYVTLMIIAWTRLFHAYFKNTIGEKYYYKKDGRYERKDGEKKTWDLTKCIKMHNKLEEPVQKNLEFFIQLRNKIEHRHIEKETLGIQIFGECQSLLYNYENLLVEFFGKDYAINENLAYSLQFSKIATKEQREAQKGLLSSEAQELLYFIEKYRLSLSQDTFNSQEYSIKLFQIPKISNTNRSDLSIEFVNWNDLTSEERSQVQKITTLIKDKNIKLEGVNVGKLNPSTVVDQVKKSGINNFSTHWHTVLWKLFQVRPSPGVENPFETNTKYCHYDEVHKDYVFNDDWVHFIVNLFKKHGFTQQKMRALFNSKRTLHTEDYEIE